MGHTITVRVVPEKLWTDDDAVGLWNPQNLLIQVRDGMAPQRIQQAFMHELVHAILDHFGHPISKDEQFVDTFAGLLHQAWSSAK
jgi:Zn-dependent peptidase ImmA (M78 family)